MTITFEQVKLKAHKAGKCQFCGLLTSNSRTLTGTISPKNIFSLGNTEWWTREEINAKLEQEKAEFLAAPVSHAKCWRKERDRLLKISNALTALLRKSPELTVTKSEWEANQPGTFEESRTAMCGLLRRGRIHLIDDKDHEFTVSKVQRQKSNQP